MSFESLKKKFVPMENRITKRLEKRTKLLVFLWSPKFGGRRTNPTKNPIAPKRKKTVANF